MIVNTRRLFLRLLRVLEVETVCDVGSMDGSDALRFRRALPRANVIALEPNPRNLALMKTDERLRAKSIRVLPVAASDLASNERFFVVDALYLPGRDRFRRGMSSLYQRSDGSRLAEVVQVPTARLDELLAAESLHQTSIALWIDTEGKAFEVISGAGGILPFTKILHVEVETEQIIGKEQRIFEDVERALKRTGFVLLATDQPRHNLQFNALFLREELLRSKSHSIAFWTRALQLRRLLGRITLRLVPLKLRRRLALLTH